MAIWHGNHSINKSTEISDIQPNWIACENKHLFLFYDGGARLDGTKQGGIIRHGMVLKYITIVKKNEIFLSQNQKGINE